MSNQLDYKITPDDIRSLRRSWGYAWARHKDSKKEAVDRCYDLLQRMIGQGWEGHVFENLGWHYYVQNGYMKVHESVYKGEKPTYYTLLGETGGNSLWTDSYHSDDPNDAVAHQIAVAKAAISSLLAIVTDFEERQKRA